jgi:hypothetical protein
MKTASTSLALQSPGFVEQPDTALQDDPSLAFSEACGVDAETRDRMIAEAAYYRAEERGFVSGYELEDWLEAEAEVDAALHSDLKSLAL